MNPIHELADLHATLSAHTNCATDGRNWRMMWQRLCEQRQEAIRDAFDDGMRKGEALARIPTTVSEVEREEWRQEREKLQDTLDLNNDEFARIAALDSANSEIRELCARARRRTTQTVPLIAQLENAEQDKCGLAADALNARQLLREFMAYVKCGQVPEDAHCARMAKRLLASDLLDARAHEGGGGGGSENLPPAEEKYNQ
jgi:hypothetical protein